MKSAERLMGMDDRAWARHANPWSAWTRVPILPLIVALLWVREVLGWWLILPLGVVLAWIWANPRAFPPPASTRSWASRAVMGERVWLARREVPIPRHHALWIGLLVYLPVLGLLPLIWGVWTFEPWATLGGLALTLCAKFWFLDRCVWLFDDMARTEPRYAAWLR
ncbi:MAG: DUF6653 family protein [Pseudomonadota bacterium]